jgi:hypothetical protein
MYGSKMALAGGGAIPVAGVLINLPAWILAAVTVTFAVGAVIGLVRPGGKAKP